MCKKRDVSAMTTFLKSLKQERTYHRTRHSTCDLVINGHYIIACKYSNSSYVGTLAAHVV